MLEIGKIYKAGNLDEDLKFCGTIKNGSILIFKPLEGNTTTLIVDKHGFIHLPRQSWIYCKEVVNG